MVLEDLIQVNRLWRKIYPYLAMQTAGIYRRDCGDVLELGPFSGGISLELAGRYPGLNITIADNSSEVLNYFNEEIRSAGLTANIRTRKTGLNPLVFNDAEFDLVIVRGAFFFLDEDGNILREIFRVIRIIDEIAEESRVLNDRLGRKRVRIQGLEQIISRARLTDNCRIVEEGGLWVIVRK